MHHLANSRFNREPARSGGAIFPDLGQGVVGPTGPGGRLPVSSFPVSSWINAGDAANENGSESYTIDPSGARYCLTFAGVFAPIDNHNVNSAKAGQAVPVMWRLTTADGTPVSDPPTYTGQCRTMTLTLSDGTTHTVSFNFR